jgi:hypothetical protein
MLEQLESVKGLLTKTLVFSKVNMTLVFSKVNGYYEMEPEQLCVEWVKDIRRGRRGLAWLTARSATDDTSAKRLFETLSRNEQRNLRARFDAWIDGLTRKQYFHGWDDATYRMCFVFKYQDIRIFGFLCHPLEDKRFEMCILSSLVTKNEWLADTTEKKRMKRLSEDLAVRKAAANPFENCGKKRAVTKMKKYKDKRGHARK